MVVGLGPGRRSAFYLAPGPVSLPTAYVLGSPRLAALLALEPSSSQGDLYDLDLVVVVAAGPASAAAQDVASSQAVALCWRHNLSFDNLVVFRPWTVQHSERPQLPVVSGDD